MHGNYFRITMALCHLTAVFFNEWPQVTHLVHKTTNRCLQTVKALARVKRPCPQSNHGNNQISISDAPKFQFCLVEATWSRHCMELLSTTTTTSGCGDDEPERANEASRKEFISLPVSTSPNDSIGTPTDTVSRVSKSRSTEMLSRCWRLLVQMMRANVNSAWRPQLVTLQHTFHYHTISAHDYRPVSHSRFSPMPADSVLSRRQPTHIG